MKFFLNYRLLLILFLALWTWQINAAGDESPPPAAAPFEDSFKAGIEHYKNQKFTDAAAAFKLALEKEPSNVSVLTNLALAQFQLGNKPLSVALLRKALNLEPDFSSPAAGLKFILPQLAIKEIPHEIQLRETLRTQLLTPVSLTVYLFLTALFLFSSGWIILSYWGARQRALKALLPLPPFPFIGLLFTVALMCTGLLTAAKIYDYQIPRGTIVEEKISVMSAPETTAVPLFDIYGGLEVIIESSKNDWVQITYPGALSGWIPKTAILATSGKALW